jgi:hypothetical protein
MKSLIFALMVCIPILLFGQVGITYTLANGQVTTDANGTYFEFDVMAQATTSGTNIGVGIVFLSYSTPAFGTAVNEEGNVTVTLGEILSDNNIYSITPNDTYPDVLALTHVYGSATAGLGNPLPDTATQLEHVKMKILDTTQPIQVCFFPGNDDPRFQRFMAGQQFDDQFENYTPVVANMCIYHDPPTVPVELSHFSATMTAENNVQLTWVSQTETNVLGYNVYRSANSDLNGALKVSPLIEGTNTSHAQTYIYVDEELYRDGTYYYWLQSVDIDGSVSYHGPASVVFSHGGQTASPPIPLVTKLENAYPNPFNPDTTIRYQLKNPGKVTIDIYNHKGQIVRSFSQSHAAPGYYGVNWDGRDSSGRALASGVYLYKMSSGSYSFTKKLILQK